MKIAMIAHDNKKIEMLNFVRSFEDIIKKHEIVATGTTGSKLKDFVPDLNLTKVASGPYGGDAQIAALIVEKKIDAVFFFIDRNLK